MDQKKNLILLWTICIVFIIYALSIKLSTNQEKENKIITDNNQEVTEATIDKSFYLEDEIRKEQLDKKDQKEGITAKAYLVGNIISGEIYIEKNSNLVLPVASMSKLITAIESIDQFSISHQIKINEYYLDLPDNLKFNEGDQFTVKELLYPLLLNSSNKAAEILASSTDRRKFMDLMSSYAWELGMESTYFADPSGINPSNISSAKDFFALAKYLYKNRPDILSITREKQVILATTTSHGYYIFNNIHPFVNHPDFIGGKTGHTKQAKDTLLTMISIEQKPIAIIVLSSDNRKKDTQYLIEKTQKILKQ